MALRFADSFDHYVTADITTKWTVLTNPGGGATGIISAGNGRNSTASFRATKQHNLQKTLDAQQIWILGTAFKITALPDNVPVFALLDSGSVQVDLRLLSDGTLRATRNGTTLGTTSFALSVNTSYFIEFKVTIDPSAGTIDVRVNGSSKLSLSSQNTRATANSTANSIVLGSPSNIAGGAFTADYDDFYVSDGTGSAPTNDFLGDVRVEALLPNGAGNTSAWTPSAGSNYQNVDETAPNADTDYNSTSNAGDVDTYNYPSITPASGTVFGVQVNMNARKDDGGTRTIAPVVRSGVTDFVGTSRNIGSTYTYYQQVYETDPNTAAAWTITNVNAAEFGIKLVA
jgi:hypothetical protein